MFINVYCDNSCRFDDLKTGLDHLRHTSSRQNEGPLVFAKTNLSTFLDCYDTLTGNEPIELCF